MTLKIEKKLDKNTSHDYILIISTKTQPKLFRKYNFPRIRQDTPSHKTTCTSNIIAEKRMFLSSAKYQ